MEKFDLIVIGGGPGGYPAAIRAAQLGASVALVEKEELGGTCLNWGCIPTKTLIASSDLFARMRRAADWGLAAGEPSFDYRAMARRKDAVVGRLRSGVGMLLKTHGVTVVTGAAAFVGPRQVRVTQSADTTLLEADRIVVATGSAPVVPGFLPRDPKVATSREFLALEKLPASLIVMGGGVIGCEFACMAAQLGAQVTVVELLDDILAMLDADLRRTVVKHMQKELGIRVLTGLPLSDIRVQGRNVTGRVGDEELRADLLLASIGRRPQTDGLDLAKAGLAEAERGGLAIDAYGRTAAAAIWAVGDVTAGSTQLAHAATAQGVAVAETLFGGSRRPLETLVPACIFTAPEIGSVGLTEQAARESGREIETGVFSLAALGKALAAAETDGFVKWVACARTGQLLGAHAVGAHATELIAEATLAIRAEWTAAELGRTIHCHPTFAESWMEAAHALHGSCVHQPPPRGKKMKDEG
jgi:dihydrolipoamide dehydrogenase